MNYCTYETSDGYLINNNEFYYLLDVYHISNSYILECQILKCKLKDIMENGKKLIISIGNHPRYSQSGKFFLFNKNEKRIHMLNKFYYEAMSVSDNYKKNFVSIFKERKNLIKEINTLGIEYKYITQDQTNFITLKNVLLV